MKKKPNYICGFIVGVFIISCSYNLYQYNKVKSYKEELTSIVSKNIQYFAGMAGNTENETVYAEQYASIVTAQEAYIVLSGSDSIDSNEMSSSLSRLFTEIKQVMLNDKEKFKETFEGTGASSLLFKISDNLDDKDSIIEVYKLLNN